ncbi:MAG: NAD(P)H-hydrate dehydratase [Oscillospiraceae bacterium]|nr:NAD(P)H-hydrate dehydratase [Oscillospiraceae bacterium]
MNYIVTSRQMKTAEENANRKGITFSAMMDNAGNACYKQLVKIVGEVRDMAFVVLCGRGNNGGDGIVLASKIKEHGGLALCVFVSDLPSSACAREKYAKHCKSDIHDSEPLNYALYTHREDIIEKALLNCDVIIDCVFGTGFDGELEPKLASLFKFVNLNCNVLKISVDIPSGVNPDTGKVAESAFMPAVTFMLGAAKKGLFSHPCFDFSGNLILLDIGIPDECYTEYEAVFVGEEILKHIPVRKKSSHKGDFGKLLNIAGSEKYIGAALLSSKAALKCGAGIVTLASVREVCRSIAPAIPELTYIPLYADGDGFADTEAAATVKEKLSGFSAVALGCGIGIAPQTWDLVETVLKNAVCPIILDADGIYLLSLNINVLKENDSSSISNANSVRKSKVILTPHPLEFSRLTGLSVHEIQSDRIRRAREFATKWDTVVVLKGVNTVIAAPDGQVFMNITGNPGLAKGGTGDVLTGIIGSFAAQGVKPLEAALLGVYLHGLVADRLAESVALPGLMPSDIADFLPFVMKEIAVI